jgi:hypothetical protein
LTIDGTSSINRNIAADRRFALVEHGLNFDSHDRTHWRILFEQPVLPFIDDISSEQYNDDDGIWLSPFDVVVSFEIGDTGSRSIVNSRSSSNRLTNVLLLLVKSMVDGRATKVDAHLLRPWNVQICLKTSKIFTYSSSSSLSAVQSIWRWRIDVLLRRPLRNWRNGSLVERLSVGE